MHLHFHEYGHGTPVVILHGLFGSLANWQTISRGLAARFRVLAVDQRNHGRSPHCPEMTYRLMADDMREFLDARGLSATHLLGHSMGGKTAMQFALSFPERVTRLVVADIAPRAYGSAHDRILHALLSLNLKLFRNRGDVEAALAPKVPDLGVRRFLLKNLARRMDGAFHWRASLENILHNCPALESAIDSSRPFEKPALFLRGARSDHIRNDDSADIHRLFPRARIVTITDAGHWIQADAPDACLEAVEDFLLDGAREDAGRPDAENFRARV